MFSWDANRNCRCDLETDLKPTMTETAEFSKYAASSTRITCERARILFVHTPVPSEDPVLCKAALNRRKRSRHETEPVSKTSTALIVSKGDPGGDKTAEDTLALAHTSQKPQIPAENRILVKPKSAIHIPTPTWHAPWKLNTVLSSHLGWVRSLAIEPVHNRLLATGSADRTIKVWNFPKAAAGNEQDSLLYTLTGHISAVRGMAFSDRHPYLFSAGEDKQVKCWDLETNQVVRHYHGHTSGVYSLALHPTVDILVTGSRDCSARVWDIRTKKQVHCLTGHDHTINAVLCKSTHPQVITGSQDSTIKMWDLVAGKSVTTLTHHNKGVRALALAPFENSFCSGAADAVRKWQGRDGKFLQSLLDEKHAIVNALAVNDDGVMVTGGDDGAMHFFDYKSGHEFQSTQAIVQPGSLEAENSIMALQFDGTGTRLITGEADKTVKIWKSDSEATEESHPIDTAEWRKKCIAKSRQRY